MCLCSCVSLASLQAKAHKKRVFISITVDNSANSWTLYKWNHSFYFFVFWSISLNIGLLLSALLLMGYWDCLILFVLLCNMSLFSEPVHKFQFIISVSKRVCVCVLSESVHMCRAGIFLKVLCESLEPVIWFPSLFLGKFSAIWALFIVCVWISLFATFYIWSGSRGILCLYF